MKWSFKIKNLKKFWVWFGIIIGVIIAVVIVCLVLYFINKPVEGGSGDGEANVFGEVMTEEEKQVTRQVMDEYADVTVEGVEEVEDELGKHNAVIVKVKNISDKTISLAIDIVAKDKDGNMLDKSSLYAEGIGPEQVYSFQTFVYSILTIDQLKAAEYDIYKAYTYNTPGTQAEETPVEQADQVPVEQSVQTPDGQTEQTAEEGVEQ